MTILDYTPYKLSDWFPKDRIQWGSISCNPKAIRMLEKNIDKMEKEKNPLGPFQGFDGGDIIGAAGELN